MIMPITPAFPRLPQYEDYRLGRYHDNEAFLSDRELAITAHVREVLRIQDHRQQGRCLARTDSSGRTMHCVW